MVVIFPLLTNGEYRHSLTVVDLKQRHIACCAKRNHQLTQKRVFAGGLAIAERRKLQLPHAFLDGVKRAFRKIEIAIISGQNKRIQTDQVRFCRFGKPNLVAQRPDFRAAFARSNIFSSFPTTALAETYFPVRCASSRASKPRAINSRCAKRRSMLSRMDCSTKPERLSPLPNTDRADFRRSGSTRSEGIVAVFIMVVCVAVAMHFAAPGLTWQSQSTNVPAHPLS